MSAKATMTVKAQTEQAIYAAAKILDRTVTKTAEGLSVNINGYRPLQFNKVVTNGKSLYEANYDNMDEVQVKKFIQATVFAEAQARLKALGYTVMSTPLSNINEGKNMVLSIS